MTRAWPCPAPPSCSALEASLQLITALYRSPSPALQDDLAAGRVEAQLKALADALGRTPPILSTVAWPELQASYVALFVTHPEGLPAPPYAGYALDGELLGPSVAALEAFYAEQGLELAATWAELPDHVAALAEAGQVLLEAGCAEAALELLRRFLLPWFRRSAPLIHKYDTSGFYGPLTAFLLLAAEAMASPATPVMEASDESPT